MGTPVGGWGDYGHSSPLPVSTQHVQMLTYIQLAIPDADIADGGDLRVRS